MKGRQLLLSLSLLLLAVCCMDTSIFAQQAPASELQTSIIALDGAGPGDPLTLTVTPFNEYTLQDLDQAKGASDVINAEFTVETNGNSTIILLNEFSKIEDIGAQAAIKQFEDYLKANRDIRIAQGIEFGPTSVTYSTESDRQNAEGRGTIEEDPQN